MRMPDNAGRQITTSPLDGEGHRGVGLIRLMEQGLLSVRLHPFWTRGLIFATKPIMLRSKLCVNFQLRGSSHAVFVSSSSW